MPKTYVNPVCRGSKRLGTSCGHCEKCLDELAELEGFGETYVQALKSGTIKPTEIANTEVKGLPVEGYKKTQPQWAIDLVNENKRLEERVLRQIDRHVRNRDSAEIDQANVQLARRHVEDAFMRLNRAVFQPQRIPGGWL